MRLFTLTQSEATAGAVLADGPLAPGVYLVRLSSGRSAVTRAVTAKR